ncbi:hypothetical protein [Mangrovimonas sp. YM274]|uniref:hypothetical protein n=1 Tax=Mangrovimonas sp. YM274 TaxID=3070660 RepID=UPI0027DAE633|nr:hypothetical protein [Mangrovimonas sp. YM274]WMI69852.1 hypothetical protein RBH95_05715 [Mangrovimonas sp. YM274]
MTEGVIANGTQWNEAIFLRVGLPLYRLLQSYLLRNDGGVIANGTQWNEAIFLRVGFFIIRITSVVPPS